MHRFPPSTDSCSFPFSRFAASDSRRPKRSGLWYEEQWNDASRGLDCRRKNGFPDHVMRNYLELIPAGRTGDGSIGRLRGFGGLLLGDATPPCLHLYRSAPIAARASCAGSPAASATAVSAPASWRSPTHSTVCHGRKPHGLPA